MLDIIFQNFFLITGPALFYLPLVGYVAHSAIFTIIDEFI